MLPAASPPTYYLYAPASLPASGPVRLLLVLHGMGGNGPDFAGAFTSMADRHGWLLAAPTFAYGDWRDPAQVRVEDVRLSQQLEALLADVPLRSGKAVRNRILLAGFSRGAQLADRFTYFHPEHVAAVASLSAGTYTVPWQAEPNTVAAPQPQPLLFPYGTADFPQVAGRPLDVDRLRQVPFWLSVGADDNNPADVPRQWDALLGQTRLERAVSFERALEQLHVSAQLTIFPHASHELTGAMTSGVDQFLAGMIQAA
jgi:poly(3-hydroxybutyrate) depolymerase